MPGAFTGTASSTTWQMEKMRRALHRRDIELHAHLTLWCSNDDQQRCEHFDHGFITRPSSPRLPFRGGPHDRQNIGRRRQIASSAREGKPRHARFVVAGFPAPLYERENRGAAYANGCDGLVFLRRKENPATGEHGGVPGPCALGERDTLLWGQRGKRFRRSRVPGTVSIRSHYGPNSDTGLCEVKARGEFSVFPTPCYSAPLGPRLGGAFS
jgi:hypothetical protein